MREDSVTWQPEIDELRKREELGRRMGGPEKIQRQHAGGKLTVRERVAGLLDAGSVHEIGAITGKARYNETGELIDDIDAAHDPAARMAEIEQRLKALTSPFRSAESFIVEEIIDPRDTRRLLCEFADLAAPLRTPGRTAFGIRP